MILASALIGMGSAVAGFFGKNQKAKDDRARLESERRQRVRQSTEQINKSSASDAGSVDVDSVDNTILESADASQASFVQDPSFFGSVFSGIGDTYNRFQNNR